MIPASSEAKKEKRPGERSSPPYGQPGHYKCHFRPIIRRNRYDIHLICNLRRGRLPIVAYVDCLEAIGTACVLLEIIWVKSCELVIRRQIIQLSSMQQSSVDTSDTADTVTQLLNPQNRCPCWFFHRHQDQSRSKRTGHCRSALRAYGCVPCV